MRTALIIFLFVFNCFLCVGQENEPITSSSSEAEPNKAAIEAKLKNAQLYQSTKKYNLAIEEFDQILALDSEYPNAYMLRGEVKFLMQDLEGAQSDYDKGIELLEKLIKGHTKTARIKRVLEDQTGAMTETQIANDLKAILSETLFRRGNVRIFLEDNTGGCDDLTKALELGYSTAIKALKEYCDYKEEKKEPATPAKK